MRNPRIFLLLALSLLALGLGAGCGESDDPPGNPGANCKITLSGGLSGSYGCIATGGLRDGEANGVIGVVSTDPAFTMLAVSFSISGAPSVRSYAPADLLEGGATVLTRDNQTYLATGGSSPMGTINSFTISGLTTLPKMDDTQTYLLRGSFSATLAPVAAGTPVTLTATF